MEETDYVKSQWYQSYIRNARLCRKDEFGALNQKMLNLMWKEKGKASVSNFNIERLLFEVKMYMTSATVFALNREIERADKGQLQNYLTRIEQASTSDELLSICEEGIELLLKYKPSS